MISFFGWLRIVLTYPSRFDGLRGLVQVVLDDLEEVVLLVKVGLGLRRLRDLRRGRGGHE
jgi:hypothetical protein